MNIAENNLMRLVIMQFVFLSLLICPGITAKPQDSSNAHQVNPKWLDKIDGLDRKLIEENLGYAPPKMTDDLKWMESDGFSWEDLKGKVVVVQSWTTKSTAGRAAPVRASKALATFDSDSIELIALHTPEGAENASKFLERRKIGTPVILDNSGLFCDEFGFYKRPTNVVIDRNGRIKYAGLNVRGLKEAVRLLLEEKQDENIKVEGRPVEVQEASNADFPAFNKRKLSGRNIQGKKAPDMYVSQWINGRPNADNKVVVIDFWATWCGPCKAVIPHMNELASRYSKDIVAIGLSDESGGKVQNFMRTTQMNYYSAVDTTARMKKAVGVSAIPHAIVMSSDWVVRWQGNPVRLTSSTLQQIIAANRKLTGMNPSRFRWSGK